MFEVHLYPHGDQDSITNSTAAWDNRVTGGAGHPIYVGEFGANLDGASGIGLPPSPSAWVQRMLDWLDLHNYNWTAWSYHPTFTPALVNADWTTPTPYFGALVKDRLAAYDASHNNTQLLANLSPNLPANGAMDETRTAIPGWSTYDTGTGNWSTASYVGSLGGDRNSTDGQHPTGHYGAQFGDSPYTVFTAQMITLYPGTTYYFNAYFKKGGYQLAQMVVTPLGWAYSPQQVWTMTDLRSDKWIQDQFSFTTSAQDSAIVALVGIQSTTAVGNQWLYFDDAYFGTANGVNLLTNPNFEATDGTLMLDGWRTKNSPTDNADSANLASFAEAVGGGLNEPYEGTHYKANAYKVFTYQNVAAQSGSPSDTYALYGWAQSGGGTATTQQLQFKYQDTPGTVVRWYDIPAATPNWTAIDVDLSGQALNARTTIGFYSDAGAGQALHYKGVFYGKNWVTDPGLETGTTANWSTSDTTTLNPTAFAVAQQDTRRPHSNNIVNNWYGNHWLNTAYQVYSFQDLTGMASSDPNDPTSTYTLSAWVMSSGGQAVAQMKATSGGKTWAVDIPQASGWTLLTLPGIQVVNGQVRIGFFSKANANLWLHFDDVVFGRNLLVNPALKPADTLHPHQLAASWLPWSPGNVDVDATYSEPSVGMLHGTQYFAPGNCYGTEVYTYQQFTATDPNLPHPLDNGWYTLSAWVRSSGGQDVAQMRVKSGSNYAQVDLNHAITDWQYVSLNIQVVNQTVEFGFYTKDTTNGHPLQFANVVFAKNLLQNPNIETPAAVHDPIPGWSLGAGSDTAASYVDNYGGAHGGSYHGTHYKASGSYSVFTYQRFDNLANGTYTFGAWVESGGGQSTARLEAKGFSSSDAYALMFTNINYAIPTWTYVVIPNIVVTSHSLTVGFHTEGIGGQWLYFDDVELYDPPPGAAAVAAPLPVADPPAPSRHRPQGAGSGTDLAAFFTVTVHDRGDRRAPATPIVPTVTPSPPEPTGRRAMPGASPPTTVRSRRFGTATVAILDSRTLGLQPGMDGELPSTSPR